MDERPSASISDDTFKWVNDRVRESRSLSRGGRERREGAQNSSWHACRPNTVPDRFYNLWNMPNRTWALPSAIARNTPGYAQRVWVRTRSRAPDWRWGMMTPGDLRPLFPSTQCVMCLLVEFVVSTRSANKAYSPLQFLRNHWCEEINR